MSHKNKKMNLVILSLLVVSAIVTALDSTLGILVTFISAILGFAVILADDVKTQKVKSKNK